MPRYLLALILLAAALSAQAITPERQDADGAGATCPETAAVAAEDEAATAEERPAAPTKTAPPAQVESGSLGRQPKAGARWHSFLPGMFK